MYKDITAWWKESNTRKYRVVIIVYVAIALALFYAFIYRDILETTRVGMNFWYDLFEGKLHYFYARRTEIAMLSYNKIIRASYEFPIYILFAVWDLPLFLLEKFGGVDVFNSVLCLMWAKTILLFFLILILREMWKTCDKLNMKLNMKVLVCVLFLTSNFLMTSVFMMSSYEVISMYFTLMGINYYMDGNNKGFHISFIAAVSMKFFALFIYLPLLLLKEKNILKIAGYTILSILPVILCRILIPFGITYPEGMESAVIVDYISQAIATTSSSMTSTLVSGSTTGDTGISGIGILYAIQHYMTIGLGRMYYSVFAFVLFFLICYLMHPKKQEELNQWVVYICAVSYSLLFITFFTHPYWIVILLPFIMILIGQNEKYIYANIVLEIVFTWGMVIGQIVRFPWCFANSLTEPMYFSRVLGENAAYELFTIETLIMSMGLDAENVKNGVMGIGVAIFTAGLLLFLILNFPKAKWKFSVTDEGTYACKGLIALRILAGWVIAMIPVAMMIIQRNG